MLECVLCQKFLLFHKTAYKVKLNGIRNGKLKSSLTQKWAKYQYEYINVLMLIEII